MPSAQARELKQELNKRLKGYNSIANLFDWHEAGCERFAPNFSEEDLTFEMAKILVKTGVQKIEIVEKRTEAAAENDGGALQSSAR